MLTETHMIFPSHIHLFPTLCAMRSLKWISMWPPGCNDSYSLKMGQYSSTPFIHSFILLSDLRQNYSLYQSKFSIQCDSAFFPFNFQFPLVSLRPSSSCLCILPHLPIISILPSIFPLIMCFRKQFLCRMGPIQLASLFLMYVGYSSPQLLCNTSSFLTWSVQLISILLQHHISKLSMHFWSIFWSI